jgi:glycosyltransferase involved in cell wall biosynthesis
VNDKLIAVDARHLKTGIGTYTKNLLPELFKLCSCRFRVIGPAYWKAYQDERVEWVFCEEKIYSLREHRLIAELSEGADLLWVPQYNAPFFARIPFVITLHDMIHRMREYTPLSLKSLAAAFLMDRNLEKAKRIITVSRYSKMKILEIIPDIEDKISIIHNGFHARVRSRAPSLFPYPYILSLGNALKHKNFERLIRAFSKIDRDLPHHLIIAGPSGRALKDMKNQAKKLSSRVHLLEHQEETALSSLMTGASLYVCPSLEEGFGMPPLEALSLGVPVAAARSSSLPEVLGEAAFWFDPRDTKDMAEVLRQAILDETGRQNVVNLGRERTAIFTWKRSAREHANVFSKILNL